MLVYMGEIASQVAVLFLMIAAGFIFFKWGGLKASYLSGMTTILLYLVTPALLIDSMLNVEFSRQTATELLTVFFVAVLFHLFAFGSSLLMFRKKPHEQRVVLRGGIILSNAGFMSLPLANALSGAKGVFLVSVYVMVFNLVSWTIVYKMFNPKDFNAKKLLLNPGLIGVALGAFFFFTGLRPPMVVAEAVRYMGSMNTPLAMVVIGGMIATGGIVTKKEEIPCMAQSISMRLLILPAIAMVALLLCPLDRELIFAIMIPMCAPIAANNAMFAGQFGADAALGSRLLAISTALSIFTMPLILALTRWLSALWA